MLFLWLYKKYLIRIQNTSYYLDTNLTICASRTCCQSLNKKIIKFIKQIVEFFCKVKLFKAIKINISLNSKQKFYRVL